MRYADVSIAHLENVCSPISLTFTSNYRYLIGFMSTFFFKLWRSSKTAAHIVVIMVASYIDTVL
jgi:hypothetical protein